MEVESPSFHLDGSYRSSFSILHPLKFPKLSDETVGELKHPDTMFGTSFQSVAGTTVLGDDTETIEVNTFIEDCAMSEEPGIEATSSLFEEFLNAFQNNREEYTIFQLLKEYEDLCAKHVDSLMKITGKILTSQNKHYRTHYILEILREERNTWRLLRTLYSDRLEVEELARDEQSVIMDTIGQRMSDKQLIEKLYERDHTVRQTQLIVDWLEKNAAEDFEYKYANKVEYFLQNSIAWENTHHILTNPKNEFSLSDQQLITELDPDAPIRQTSLKLHDLDKRDETMLLKYMFACLRSGQLTKAEQLAERFGHPWLSAALEGWRLYHDNNYHLDAQKGDILSPVEGNPYRDVWKLMCWKISEEVSVPEYERAMYASLSGNIKTLLPVCLSWEDYLWAYMKVVLDVRIEQELRSNATQERPMEQLPSSYWDKMLTPIQVFEELQACTSEVIQKESTTHHHIIQKYIILDQLEELVEEMYEWSQSGMSISRHLLRFMAHVILFIRVIGRSCREELAVAILESYVKDLIEKHQVNLIAAYTATLPQLRQIYWYAKFLEGVEETTERQLCLQLAEKVELDVARITKTVVENIRSIPEAIEETSTLSSETTKEDQLKIEAIDWLVFDTSQRSEAIKQANAMMRTFIASNKLDAARRVFSKIPPDSIDIVIKQWRRITGATELSPEDDNATREYLCFQAYLQAQDAFNDWFEHYHRSKPKEPHKPEHNRFTEWIAFEQRMKQYEADLERWEQSLWSQTKSTTERIYNVLLFVDGGWMVDQRTEGPIDEARQTQMALLRKLCIPQMCFLLHTVLHSTSQYKECLQLADIITSEKNQLYKEFNIQELENLQSKLLESSLQIDQKYDLLGY